MPCRTPTGTEAVARRVAAGEGETPARRAGGPAAYVGRVWGTIIPGQVRGTAGDPEPLPAQDRLNHGRGKRATELGRFAVEYGQALGESPSETLRR